jgi:hypothetical protein
MPSQPSTPPVVEKNEGSSATPQSATADGASTPRNSESQPTLKDESTDLEKHDTTSHRESADVAGSLDPNIVGWDGDTDPANPMNWSGKKKWINAGLLSAMTFIT